MHFINITKNEHTCFCPHIFFRLSYIVNFVFVLLLPLVNLCTQLVDLEGKERLLINEADKLQCVCVCVITCYKMSLI